MDARPLVDGSLLPLVVEGDAKATLSALADWAAGNRVQLDGWLHRAGGVLFRGSSTAIKYTAMGVFTAVLLVGLTWLGSRSRRLLLIVALIVLALSALNSWGAYHVFRA